MRNQALLLAPLLAAAAVTSGCPGNNPSLPPLYQGGWSWNPTRGFGIFDAPVQDKNEAAIAALDREFGDFK